ncbi:two-component response regulator bacteriocin, partial [Lacticaseibacillus rhamnosus MTCC 5462]
MYGGNFMSKNKTILNIYILEDNPDYLTFIQETVQQYLLIEELPAKIRLATTSASELLATIDWSAINDSIFLLDIELGDSATSGVDVATAIRRKSY